MVRTPTGVQHPKLREVDRRRLRRPHADRGRAGRLRRLLLLPRRLVGRAWTRPRTPRSPTTIRWRPRALLAELNPELTFIYVSGAGTDAGRPADVGAGQGPHRARGHRALPERLRRSGPASSSPPTAPAPRPAGTTPSTRVTAPLIPLLDRVAPKYVTTHRPARPGHAARRPHRLPGTSWRTRTCAERSGPTPRWPAGTTSCRRSAAGGGVPSPNGRPPSSSRPCAVSQFARSGPAGHDAGRVDVAVHLVVVLLDVRRSRSCRRTRASGTGPGRTPTAPASRSASAGCT